MIANIVWFGMLLSGSFFACAKFNRKFEEIFPVSGLVLVLALFVCGILGFLKYSAILFLAVSLALYACTLGLFLFKKADISSFLKHFFTPGFALLCVYFLLFNIVDFNLLATQSDEFSHWMDSIQVMTHLDDFVTNPASNSLFKSYPPAMTLFQYLFQKIYLLFNPGNPFSEWRMYLAFQIFTLSILFPFLKDLSFKKPLSICCVGMILFLFPLPFFPKFHYSVYIDPVVGILAGCGLAMPLLYKEKDFVYTLYVSLICAVLVLTKDVGLFFASFVALLNIAVFTIHCRKLHSFTKTQLFSQLFPALLPVGLLVLCKSGWSYVVQVNHAEVSFGNRIDLLKYTSMFFLNNDGTTLQTIVSNFKDAFYTLPFPIGSTNIVISYFDLFCISFIVLYFVCRKYILSQPDHKATVIALGCTAFAQLAIYVYSLGATYVYNFVEYEALALASYERYNHISYLAVWIVILMITLLHIQNHTAKENRNFLLAGLTVCMFLLSPMKNVSDFLNRDIVRDSFYVRSQFTPMTEQISNFCDESDRIYFIAQKDNGSEYRAVKFAVYPNHITNTDGWSLGDPYYENDVWTQKMTADQWAEILQRDYDYVALFNVDDGFIRDYGILFEDPGTICDDSLYYINKELGILEKCE